MHLLVQPAGLLLMPINPIALQNWQVLEAATMSCGFYVPLHVYCLLCRAG
jgi:hypothetical protein